MFSERKGIWLFLFSKEKKGNLFLRFWLILFYGKKRILFSERRKKKISFVLRILLFLFLEKKNNFTKPNKQVVCWFTKKEILVQSTRKGFEP